MKHIYLIVLKFIHKLLFILVYLRINNNQFTGEIPASICGLNINWASESNFKINQNRLCPPYPICIEEYVGEQDDTNCE